MFKTLLIAGAMLLAGLSSAAAADYFDLDDPVAGHPGKTWTDLVRAIVPDLGPDGQGSTVIDLPYLVDLGDGDPPPAPQLPVSISSVEVEPIRADGRRLTAVLVDLGGADGWALNVVALALFDENLALLDVVNIGQDRFNGFKPPVLRISERDEALLTYSEHGNSNQRYNAYGLIMVREGKFQVIDTFATLDDWWCGHERRQTLAFDIEPAGPGYWPIRLTITDRLAKSDPAEDCGDEVPQPSFENTYAVTYNWSASLGQYVADGNGLAPLDDINLERY